MHICTADRIYANPREHMCPQVRRRGDNMKNPLQTAEAHLFICKLTHAHDKSLDALMQANIDVCSTLYNMLKSICTSQSRGHHNIKEIMRSHSMRMADSHLVCAVSRKCHCFLAHVAEQNWGASGNAKLCVGKLLHNVVRSNPQDSSGIKM